MNLTDEQQAFANFKAMARNPYPGRGIVVGRSEDGKNLVQVYWIMGRSPSSRNRRFIADGGRVFTDTLDPAIKRDPLTIYNAMAEHTQFFAVSNGAQTDRMMDLGPNDLTSALAMHEYEFEPDAPNFTPRIQGYCSRDRRFNRCVAGLGILARSPSDGRCIRTVQEYDEIDDGLGYCVTTYQADGNPLPAFDGLPIKMPLIGGISEVAHGYWQMLSDGNKVAIAVKFIEESSEASSEVITINKYGNEV